MKRLVDRASTYLEAMRRDDPDIGGHPVSELDIDDVTDHQLLGVYVQLLSVTDNQRELKPHSYVTTVNSIRSELLRLQ